MPESATATYEPLSGAPTPEAVPVPAPSAGRREEELPQWLRDLPRGRQPVYARLAMARSSRGGSQSADE